MPGTADALDPRLASARAKFERAEGQATALIEEMKEACAGRRPGVAKTSRRYDASTERVLFVAEEVVPEVPEIWGLAIGEIVYNLRCALDHLWWALAADHLGREPTLKEAGAVQFPILDQAQPESVEFGNHQPSVGDVVLAVKVVMPLFGPFAVGIMASPGVTRGRPRQSLLATEGDA